MNAKIFLNLYFVHKNALNKIYHYRQLIKPNKSIGDTWQTQWENYKSYVIKLTEFTYKKFKHIINPNNLERKRGKFHLDHKIPKIYGFLNKIKPEIISHYKNLQMLTESENCSKQNKVILNINELLTEIKHELTKNNYYDKTRIN